MATLVTQSLFLHILKYQLFLLRAENSNYVPLHNILISVSGGVRIAVCSIPKRQITGLAQRIYDAMKRVGQV